MEFKHTPAPWRPATMGPNGCSIVGSKTTMVAMLAHSVNKYNQAEQAKANAHLIAAAPELLEALVKLIDYINCDSPIRNTDEFDCAKLAIKKALGETR